MKEYNLNFFAASCEDKAMGDYQGGEEQLSPLGEPEVHASGEVKNLITDFFAVYCRTKSGNGFLGVVKKWFSMKIILIFVLSVGLFGCQSYRRGVHQPVLTKTDFKHLPSWQADDHGQALIALQKSCVAIARRDPEQPFSGLFAQAGKVKVWQKICAVAESYDGKKAASGREFFERWFVPYLVSDRKNYQGLFTGYYLPELHCSLKRSSKYKVPIYALPDDWIKVDLGLFDKRLKNRTIVGQVKNKNLYPYPSRAAITRGAINKTAEVLAWCDDKIAVAFAHIQGSAIIRLPDEKQLLIGYEGSNGRSYTAIGKVLIKNGELTKQNCSMQDIRAWFDRHPQEIDKILNKNDSYVFFRVLTNESPLGSQQIPLTPERSLAVDKRYIPLGAPLWLVTTVPSDDPEKFMPFRRLLIAQDTGGAIKGIVRGDVYWGAGEQAAFWAGHMKNLGKYYILLPQALD